MSAKPRLDAVALNATHIFREVYPDVLMHHGNCDDRVIATGASGHAEFVECQKTGIRIILMTLDSQPNTFIVAGSHKETPDTYIFSDVLPVDRLNSSTLFEYMEKHFAK